MARKSTALDAKIAELLKGRSDAVLLLAQYDHEIKGITATLNEAESKRLSHQRYIEGIDYAIGLLRDGDASPELPGVTPAPAEKRAAPGEIEKGILGHLNTTGMHLKADQFPGKPSSVRAALKRLVAAGKIGVHDEKYYIRAGGARATVVAGSNTIEPFIGGGGGGGANVGVGAIGTGGPFPAAAGSPVKSSGGGGVGGFPPPPSEDAAQ